MRRLITGRRLSSGLACAAGLLLAPPVAAQEDGPAAEAAVLDMLQGVFAAEPLTAEQAARLPEATRAVTLILPDGFYARIMGDVIGRIIDPLFGQAAVLSTRDLAARLGQDIDGTLPELDEATRRRLTAILDPAAEQRAAAFGQVLDRSLTQIYSQLEGPMREGLAKAYAARFDDHQLTDINAFFATPTGAVYASESMAAFTDPQMMGAMMEALPLMMQQLPLIAGEMEGAMGDLPEPRSHADLTPDQRQELAAAFGLSQAELAAGMARADAPDDNPDKAFDDDLPDD